MLNALRLTAGVPMSSFRERTGLAESQIAPLLDGARQRGLIAHDDETLRATTHGQRYLNDLTALFLPDAA
jgi:oxygen-independent coproporphyrinogen-3 oxidase